MKCRNCSHELTATFVDLGSTPPSNSYLKQEQLNEPEVYYPLKVMVCDKCFLVQVDEFKKSEDIFNSDYAYFSSYSKSWLQHSKAFVDMISMRLGLNSQSQVIEIASNDGYLLQYFNELKIPNFGIEPTNSTAEVAIKKGIEVWQEFFGTKLAQKINAEKRQGDLILGNNVLAHVPDINDFVHGLSMSLKPLGTVTMEFPHLLQLVANNQFDTIYHEHFSYLSLIAVKQIFEKFGLAIYDVEELSTHGGSLRIYAKHASNNFLATVENVSKILKKETDAGMGKLDYYLDFQAKANNIKLDFLSFLINAKKENKKIIAYGAAAKGNTLMNYCGVKNDLISFVVDASPFKQNKYMPGSHIPIYSEDEIKKFRPDYVIILPWNIKEEVVKQLEYIRTWDAKFVVAIPHLATI